MIRFSSFDDILYYITKGVYDLIPSCKIEWDANIHYLSTWFKNYDPLKVGVNSFWDTLY